MYSRITEVLGWILGLGALAEGTLKILSNPLEALFYLSSGAMIFPPLSRWITKFSFARWVKIGIGAVFFGSLILSAYLSAQPSSEKKLDSIRSGNVQLLTQLARDMCKKQGKCPATLDQIFSSGATAPFESFNEGDYSYTSLDNGKECLITTPLSDGQNYCGLCVGDSLSSVKYLSQAKCKP